MIRLLFLIVVFVLGLAGAVVFMGQMHHLRLAVPDRLPGWSAQIAEDAGLTRGTMELPATPHLPATVLSWRAVTPDADGWHWQLRLTGPGIALAARLTLPLWPERADIGDGSGSVDMAAIKGLPVDVAGLLTLEALTLTASPLRPAPSVSGNLRAGLTGLRIDGTDFGKGPLVASLDASGKVQADLTLQGGVSPISAKISGSWPNAGLQLDLEFADGPALPADLRAMLAAVGRPAGQGWHLSVPLPFP